MIVLKKSQVGIEVSKEQKGDEFKKKHCAVFALKLAIFAVRNQFE